MHNEYQPKYNKKPLWVRLKIKLIDDCYMFKLRLSIKVNTLLGRRCKNCVYGQDRFCNNTINGAICSLSFFHKDFKRKEISKGDKQSV